MSDSLSKIFAIIIAALILFIFPIKNEFERVDETSRMYALTETARFVDSVRNLGYITPMMYLKFSRKLSLTDNIYDIELEHRQKRYDPIYDDPADPTSFIGKYNINYEGRYTNDILGTLFPVTPYPDTDPLHNGNYQMSKGDYFSVKVKNKNKTMATRIQEMLYNTSLSSEKIFVNYGGMIKDEAN